MTVTAPVPRLVDQFERGLDAPICLTWELTYACNLSCVHCLSSSGKRDPRELTTQQCKDIIDELDQQPGDYLITKRRRSAFHDTGLDTLLRDLPDAPADADEGDDGADGARGA